MNQEKKEMDSKGKEVNPVLLPRILPGWVQSLVADLDGIKLRFLIAKTLISTDLDRHLFLPDSFVDFHLIPALCPLERMATGLHDGPRDRSTSFTIEGEEKQEEEKAVKKTRREAANQMDGMEVPVYTRRSSPNCFKLRLVRWERFDTAVLFGVELGEFLRWSGFGEMDEMEIWGFREGKEKRLCLVICEKAYMS